MFYKMLSCSYGRVTQGGGPVSARTASTARVTWGPMSKAPPCSQHGLCVLVVMGPSHHLEAGLLSGDTPGGEAATAFLPCGSSQGPGGWGLEMSPGEVKGTGNPALCFLTANISWFLGAFVIFASFSSCSFHCSSYSVSKV